jgi:hypothetical protein
MSAIRENIALNKQDNYKMTGRSYFLLQPKHTWAGRHGKRFLIILIYRSRRSVNSNSDLDIFYRYENFKFQSFNRLNLE